MPHSSILDGQKATLLIVDVQEAFRKYIQDLHKIAQNISILIKAAQILQLPVMVTEQYPLGLGKTVIEIASCLEEHYYFEKTAFSCCQAKGFLEVLAKTGRTQVIVCGIEAHVCINQTTHELLEHKYRVHVVHDAVASREQHNKDVAWAKMLSSGAIPSTLEMALFEMLSCSGTQEFKAIQKLIK